MRKPTPSAIIGAVEPRDLKLHRLTDRVLRDGGRLPLALLLEVLVPTRRLRQLASKFGVAPKGFRVERAPAHALALLLSEQKEPARLQEVVELLQAEGGPPATADGGAPETDGDAGDGARDETAEPGQARAAQQWQEQEIARLRDELERARQGTLRTQEREATLRQQLEREADLVQALRAEVRRISSRADLAPTETQIDRDTDRRLHELEQEIEARAAQDEALRRQQALDRTRIRELEDEVAELERALPKGRRRKVAPEPPPPPPRRFLLPYFQPSFYRSLDGKDRKSVERALQAILLFCTEGHAYPGLDVKQLGGQDTWSLRVSLGLRIYFRHRDDGDVEFLELADREEQNTTLRRLKER